MPLRMRLIVWIGSVLLGSLACGSALVGWHESKSVQVELRAALAVGENTIRNGLVDLAESDDGAARLRHLIATFDGNRHVRATLLDAFDQPVATSALLIPLHPAPDWFRRLIANGLAAVRLPLRPAGDGGGTIVLQADATNEVSEVWAESRDAVLVLAGFALLIVLMVYAVVGHALRPLEVLSTAFGDIGKGNYHGRVPQRGPPEVLRLADNFNLMTDRLAAAAAQNRRLNERLLTLQAEERAELARDLHDEIGPLLFAVDMTAATIERLADGGRGADIPGHARSIHDAVVRTQRHVRAILERLRPLQAQGVGSAVSRLVTFWRSRRPDIRFVIRCSIEEDRMDDDVKETIYRVVQEGISNAIRHGQPTCVEITIAHNTSDDIIIQVSDDGTGMQADGASSDGRAQLGLIGMRERVMAMAGSLSIQRGGDGKGLTLMAQLPCIDAQQSQMQGEPE